MALAAASGCASQGQGMTVVSRSANCPGAHGGPEHERSMGSTDHRRRRLSGRVSRLPRARRHKASVGSSAGGRGLRTLGSWSAAGLDLRVRVRSRTFGASRRQARSDAGLDHQWRRRRAPTATPRRSRLQTRRSLYRHPAEARQDWAPSRPGRILGHRAPRVLRPDTASECAMTAASVWSGSSMAPLSEATSKPSPKPR
jgi:hypothetical protein